MIVPAQECHVCQMLEVGIRQEDLNEMQATSGLPPEVSLRRSLRASIKAWAALDKRGIAYCMFGVAPWPHTPELGSPWLLATPAFDQHAFDIIRNTKWIVKAMGEDFDFLVNYVDYRLITRLPWVEWAGFKYDDFIPEFGVERRPFLRFSKAT